MRKALSSASKESVHFSRRAVARAMIVIILLRDDDIIRATYVRTLARGEKLADEAVHGGGLLVDHDGAMVGGRTPSVARATRTRPPGGRGRSWWAAPSPRCPGAADGGDVRG